MLKLTRHPKSPYWQIRGTESGFRIQESTGTADRRQAEEILAKRQRDLHTERVFGKRATKTFAQAALSYLDAGGETRFLGKILDHFGTTPLANIGQAALEAGALKLHPQAAPATVNRQFWTPAVAVLTHAARLGWCDRPIVSRPKLPKGRVRWLKQDEIRVLVNAAAPHLRPLLTFCFLTGARIGEALWLDWRNVDLERAHADFLDTKNGTDRGVPLHPDVVAALSALPHREGEVFRTDDGKAYARPAKDDDRDTSAGSRIKTAFKGACRRAGITNFRPHDMRHTWATHHYRANRDLAALQRLGGWSKLEMVLRYAHTNVEEHADTIAALPSIGGKLVETKSAKLKKR
jgi:integrase